MNKLIQALFRTSYEQSSMRKHWVLKTEIDECYLGTPSTLIFIFHCTSNTSCGKYDRNCVVMKISRTNRCYTHGISHRSICYCYRYCSYLPSTMCNIHVGVILVIQSFAEKYTHDINTCKNSCSSKWRFQRF